jgi:hypothetical protein
VVPNPEIIYPGNVSVQGIFGIGVRRLQEWLTLQGFTVKIDGVFDYATENALLRFQEKNALEKTGTLDEKTWAALIGPLLRAQTFKLPGVDFASAVVAIAKAHLAQHPREVGGDNMGPWVRSYTRKLDADPWSAGFASAVWKQAADSLEVVPPYPLDQTQTVAWLVEQAKSVNRYREGPGLDVAPGAMSFVLSEDKVPRHAGILIEQTGRVITTIEADINSEVTTVIRPVDACHYGVAVP